MKKTGRECLAKIQMWIAGSYQQWYRRLLPLYGSWRKRQLESRIRLEQKKTLCRMGLCIVTVLFCTVSVVSLWIGTERELKPEDVIGTCESLVLEYDGIRRRITLERPERQQEESREDETLLREARIQISREMLGNNPDWKHVSGALSFPKQLPSGVFVRYETSDPSRISEQGFVDGIGAGEGIPVTIGVTMTLGSAMEKYTLECIVVPPKTEEDVQQALQFREERLLTALKEKNVEEERLLKEIFNDVAVSIAKPMGERITFLLLSGMLTVMVFIGRFSKAESQREQKKKALAGEIPMLMDQLILMMNAGLILSEALEMASISTVETREEGTLASDLRFLCRRAEESKRSVIALLCEYALETGCSELMRFSTMLMDHVDRGSSALIQQLKIERNYALETQWKQKEGRCRTMEVKLSGPLILLLSVILLLTIGPVMIGI